MRRRHALSLAAPFLLTSPKVAFAHSYLKTAQPAVNGVVTVAPSEVTITFSEGVEPRFSSIEVQNAQGQRVDNNDAHTPQGDATRLSTSLKTLPPGVYKVIWHATSVDTHKTNGTYKFTVGP